MKRVYFIKPIGSPAARLGSLETWSPFPLEVIAELPGDMTLERRFHAKFQDSHERREWFGWTPELQATVDAIKAGRFDVDSLPAPFGIACYVGGRKRPRTADQRRQLSLSLRVSHLASRSGWAPPFEPHGMIARGDATAVAKIEAYLSAPHLHGRPIQSERAAKARATFMAEYRPNSIEAQAA